MSPFGTLLIGNKKPNDPVEVVELHWLLRKYYPDISIRFAQLLFSLIDANNDGTLTQAELSLFLPILKRTGASGAESFDLIFAAADTNGNGTIDAQELNNVIDRLKLPPNLKQQSVNMSKEQFKQFMAPYTEHVIGIDDVPFEDVLDKRSGPPASLAQMLGVETDLRGPAPQVQI